MSTEPVSDTGHHRAIDSKRLSFWVTEQAVYGVILVGGLILVSGEKGEASWGSFWTVVITVAVFWAAHVFAGVVAHPRVLDGESGSLSHAIRESMRNARGLVVASVVPCLVLLLGSIGVISDEYAFEIALWSGIVVLGVIGYLAFMNAGYRWFGRLLGGLMTGSFGVALIVVKALVH